MISTAEMASGEATNLFHSAVHGCFLNVLAFSLFCCHIHRIRLQKTLNGLKWFEVKLIIYK
jgi:hypothetical protein